MGSTHGIPGRFAPEYQSFMQETARCCGSCGRCLFAICAQRCIIRQKQRVFSLFLLSPSSRRAWIEILRIEDEKTGEKRSPSSRRAWIEITQLQAHLRWLTVALLAEGVDRNARDTTARTCAPRSPSSRRAWIEIQLSSDAHGGDKVALLAEGVDRNQSPVRIH